MVETLRLLAAGSLSHALTDLGPVASRPVLTEFGPSGLLCTAIEDGVRWDLFASADTWHPARLHAAGVGTAPHVFCRNALSILIRSGLTGTDAASLLRHPDLRVGISTPGNDPSGDYAVAALDRLEAGLGARALRLTGAPGLPRPPSGRNPYAWLLDSGAADLFVTYRTNALAALLDAPELRAIDLPDAVQVKVTYAMTTRQGATAAAQALADCILSAEVQSRLAALGFEPVGDRAISGVTA